MKKLLILMLFGVLFVPMNGSAKADEVFYCQSEAATGLALKDDGTWAVVTHATKRYTIKVVGDFEKIFGVTKDTGYSCEVPLKYWAPHRIACSDTDGETFFYDKQTKRFYI